MQSYVVGFKVYDGRSLQTQDGMPCDPFVVVECCGNAYQTSTLEDRMQLCPWNEPCIWPSVELYEKEFESAYIEFKVYARNWFTRNYLIGMTSMQLDTVNKRKHHLYARHWLCLRRDDSPETLGMLNVTCFCLRPGEQAPSATEQETMVDDGQEEEAAAPGKGGGEENLAQAVLKTNVEPPAGKEHHVMVNVHRVEDLQTVMCPYVTVEFCGCIVKTIVAKDVKQYTFNDSLRIPVTTPIYEDTILLKLWTSNWLTPDELLAQGLISFSELRNNQLAPRWFNLYGWDPEEIPDVTSISAAGKEPEPNYFRGRLLISGRVDRLEEGDELQASGNTPARAIVEPAMMQKALLADVYMVTGAEGRNCKIKVAFGVNDGETPFVPADGEKIGAGLREPGDDDEDEGEDDDGLEKAYEDTVSTFSYNQNQGRIIPLLTMTPEDSDSQPFVMISAYTDSIINKGVRVGYAKRKMNDFPDYDNGNPSKPRFIALESMPDYAGNRNPPSVLITIEKHRTDDVVRHNRKTIKPMIYIVRAYCFMARNINYVGMRTDTDNSTFSLRVTCAGISQTTKRLKGPRPTWMTPISLKVFLCSDSKKEPPTIEPITLTFMEEGTLMDSTLGKAVCVYTHMRKKDSLKKWEPCPLNPQWIKVYGGTYGNQCVAEILTCFEIIVWKFRDDMKLQPRIMWPQPEEIYSKKDHFSCLRKATLHFSMHGLRDLVPLKGMAGTSTVAEPVVTVTAQKLNGPPEPPGHEEELVEGEDFIAFQYRKVMPGGDERVKGECFKKWYSTVNGVTSCQNMEFLQVKKLNIEVPDRMILQPCIEIKVHQTDVYGIKGFLSTSRKTLIGESLQSIANQLPCVWFEGVDRNMPFREQMTLIRARLEEAEKASMVRDNFKQFTDAELKEAVQDARQYEDDDGPEDDSLAVDTVVKQEEEKPQFLDSTGIPLDLRSRQEARRKVRMKVFQQNMQLEESFSNQDGEEVKIVGGDSRKSIAGKLENSKSFSFNHDFWYKNAPLLKNSDVIDLDDENQDFGFQPGRTFGFVKCTYKLTDQWDPPPELDEDGNVVEVEEAQDEDDDEDEDSDREDESEKFKRSINSDPILNKYAFSEKKLVKKYKGERSIPSRVRVRIYLVKAVCIYGKSGGFADPFLEFRLGQNVHVSMRNMVKYGTNTPAFYRTEERDIELPDDARLEITVQDANALSDVTIGGTVLDLEDRWHSSKWKKANEIQNTPMEARSLFTNEHPGLNRGTVEMWVEMIESVQASDKKPSPNNPPPQTEIEVRFVCWKAKCNKLVQSDNTVSSVKISTNFTCKEYSGEYYAQQYTDVHYNSIGPCVFNWRILYPKIKMPTESATVKVDMWNHELLGDTPLGTMELDIKKYLEKVAANLDALTMGPHDLKFSGIEDQEEDVGTVNMTMWVMTGTEALSRRVGIAREEPNEDPQLITPTEGRGWGDYLAGFGFPDFGLWKKFLALFISMGLGMVFFLASTIALKQTGLL